MANIKKDYSKARLLTIQEELNQLLSDVVGKPTDRFSPRCNSLELSVDVYECDDAFHVRAEVPGMGKGDLDVFITRDLLMIEGKKQPGYGGDKVSFVNLEREFGKFKRDIGIPKPVDTQNAKASMKDGVLEVVLPKISDRRGKRKRIPID